MAVQVSTSGSFEFTSFASLWDHVYCNVWTPVVNEVLTLKREPDNHVSVHTVALTRDGEIAGHRATCNCQSCLVLLVHVWLLGRL